MYIFEAFRLKFIASFSFSWYGFVVKFEALVKPHSCLLYRYCW